MRKSLFVLLLLSMFLQLSIAYGQRRLRYCREGDLYGFKKGEKVIIEPQYEQVQYRFSDGLAGAKKDGKWGFINIDNEVVIDFQYEHVSMFEKGKAIVAKEKQKKGIINKQNEVLLAFDYRAIYKINKNSFAVMRDSLWQFLNADDYQPINDYKYEDFYNFYNGNILVQLDGYWGGLDKKGKELKAPTYEYIEVEALSEFGQSFYRREGKFGFINDELQELTAPIYDTIYEGWVDDYLFFFPKQNGKTGIRGYWEGRDYGNQMFDSIYYDYDDIGDTWINPYLIVCDEGKYGLISFEGGIIPCRYDSVYRLTSECENHPVMVKKNGKYGFYQPDRRSKAYAVLTDCEYDILIEDYPFDFFAETCVMPIRKQGYVGFVSKKKLIEPKYEAFDQEHFYYDEVRVKENGKWHIIKF